MVNKGQGACHGIRTLGPAPSLPSGQQRPHVSLSLHIPHPPGCFSLRCRAIPAACGALALRSGSEIARCGAARESVASIVSPASGKKTGARCEMMARHTLSPHRAFTVIRPVHRRHHTPFVRATFKNVTVAAHIRKDPHGHEATPLGVELHSHRESGLPVPN